MVAPRASGAHVILRARADAMAREKRIRVVKRAPICRHYYIC